MRKIYSLLAGLLFSATTALAVPAKPQPIVVTQPDGTQLTVCLVGDESFHFWQTLDGVPLVRLADGEFHYARLADGALLSSGRLAHEAALRTVEEKDFVLTQAVQLQAVRQLQTDRRAAFEAKRTKPLGLLPSLPGDVSTRTVGKPSNITGDKKGLVILVNYQDVTFAPENTREEFDAMMNQEGYTGGGNSYSVHDYFKAQSYGQLNLTFDVVGPYTLSQEMAYYGKNDGSGNDGYGGARMVAEACRLADDDVDFSQYDWDNDGVVDQVFVIYAGYSEAQGGPSTSIWPHEWELSAAGYSVRLDGVKVNTYACTAERIGSSGTKRDGIGTACHEFSHCFGIPDMYDTNGTGSFAMGSWSIMEQGCYANNGYSPVGYTAYERMFCNWLTPTELTERGYIEDMKPLHESPEAYILYNDANRNEFYLLENRQISGTDIGLSGHGLLVTHVNYVASRWTANGVNNSYYSTKGCAVVPADGSSALGSIDLAGDPFPGRYNVTELTDETSPKMSLYNKNTDGTNLLHKPITAISEQYGKVNFRIMGGIEVLTPAPRPAADVTPTAFTAEWDAVDHAEAYEIELRRSGSMGLAECLIDSYDLRDKDTDLTADSETDMSGQISSYLGKSGWTASLTYRSAGKLRMGSSFVDGWITSPLYTGSETGYITVRVDEAPVRTADKTFNVILKDYYGNEICRASESLTDTVHTLVLKVPTNQQFRLTIHSPKRMYLRRFSLYDGEFTADDFARAEQPDSTLTPEALNAPARVPQTVAGTSYRFTGLTQGAEYEWRIKATARAGESEWSEWQTVQLTAGDPTAIARPETSADAPAEVYSLTGQRLATTTLSAFRRLPLPAGTYLLRTAKGTLKVVK